MWERVDSSCWTPHILSTHQSLGRELVCQACAELGYMPGRYEKHQCEECLQTFGCRKFHKNVKQNAKRQKTSRLVCKACKLDPPNLQCSKCKIRYKKNWWTSNERHNHKGAFGTRLVCKACRSQGFHPRDCEAYECKTCARRLGSKMFDKVRLYKYKKGKCKSLVLQCLRCSDEAQ